LFRPHLGIRFAGVVENEKFRESLLSNRLAVNL